MVNTKTILDVIPHIAFHGKHVDIEQITQLGKSDQTSSLFWCGDKYREQLIQQEAGTVIISSDTYAYVQANGIHSNEKFNWLVVEQPRRAFAQILGQFFAPQKPKGVISSSAFIDPTVELDRDTCYIGHNVVIEAGCKLGSGVVIEHNTVLHAHTELGDQVKIGSNCTIGGVGFGYEMNDEGQYGLMPHIGNVRLEKNVEIGNNVCIDRAVIGSTHLSENVKVDNLVHIAHGVQVGSNSLVIANAMVAGSVQIGKNVWVAPSSSIIQKVKVGDNALIGLSSTVLKDVGENEIVVGSPAKKIKTK